MTPKYLGDIFIMPDSFLFVHCVEFSRTSIKTEVEQDKTLTIYKIDMYRTVQNQTPETS